MQAVQGDERLRRGRRVPLLREVLRELGPPYRRAVSVLPWTVRVVSRAFGVVSNVFRVVSNRMGHLPWNTTSDPESFAEDTPISICFLPADASGARWRR